MSPRRRSRRLVVLVMGVFTLLLVEGVIVAFVFISPSAGERLAEVKGDIVRAWSGTEDSPGIRTRVAGVVHRGYEGWIVPLWQGPQPPEGDPEFTACVKCHKDYASTRRFDVYMNHPLHAQMGVECTTCHPQNVHPAPPHPQEEVCASCHDEVDQKGKCTLCHPPASLPHFYLLGAARGSVVQCDVCHPKETFASTAMTPKVHVGDFSGLDRGRCLSCHQATTCQQCHASEHAPNWADIHGRQVAYQGYGSCQTCHTGTWCADRCHSVTPLNPFVPRPLPTAGVRP